MMLDYQMAQGFPLKLVPKIEEKKLWYSFEEYTGHDKQTDTALALDL